MRKEIRNQNSEFKNQTTNNEVGQTLLSAKKSKGITLVALIITIIVLIILAGVSLNIALGENGIFKKSKNAVDVYKEEAKMEETELDKIYDTMESLDPNSLAAKVKVGDYVNYNPTAGVEDLNLLTYTSPIGSYSGDYNTIDSEGRATGNGEHGNGYSEQKFKVPEDITTIKWRVLSVQDGCVNLVSEQNIGRNGIWDGAEEQAFWMDGWTGYAYAIQELNSICNIYGKGNGAKYARSIEVEDTNKLIGYNPENDERFPNYNKIADWGNKWRNTYYCYSDNTVDCEKNKTNEMLWDGNFWYATLQCDLGSNSVQFYVCLSSEDYLNVNGQDWWVRIRWGILRYKISCSKTGCYIKIIFKGFFRRWVDRTSIYIYRRLERCDYYIKK